MGRRKPRLMLTINCEGADFGNADTGTLSVADATEKVATLIRDGHTEGMVRDANGSTQGSWTYEPGRNNPDE
jgi:hypothetical protein